MLRSQNKRQHLNLTLLLLYRFIILGAVTATITATTLDNDIGLLVANDFLTHKTTGETVFQILSDCIDCIQCCAACLATIKKPIVTPADVSLCKTSCPQCIVNIRSGHTETCEECAAFSSPYSQLRPCSRCLVLGIRCRTSAVLAIPMDCESNNAKAMRMTNDNNQLPDNMLLLNSIPDAVHAGKKSFRASANWWLHLDGYRINNSILRSLRQFEKSASVVLRPLISDSTLRNRDRMDYGAILESTSSELSRAVSNLADIHGSSVTCTIFPDSFWKSRGRGALKSSDDICAGEIDRDGLNATIVVQA